VASAVFRRGASGVPGAVPQMWRYMATIGDDTGANLRDITAEHHALVLFGFHQQSQPQLVHVQGVPLGRAVWQLRSSFSPDAVDRRFINAVTANDLDEVVHHLRGLVLQLRSVSPVLRFDYTQLVKDLGSWQRREQVDGVRLRWGRAYHGAGSHDSDDKKDQERQ